ncbi:MAG: DUF86 domain-containing protein [Clostridia bacterium]|nr:DUF86 domain-containing protein [Clostridia bacterium]
MQHRDLIIITKIASETDIALKMLENVTFSEFNRNEILKRAVCMTVINIGELVKSLSSEFRLKHGAVPWKAIAGFRDIAAHKYQTLHMEDVYYTVVNDFPPLNDYVKNIKSE